MLDSLYMTVITFSTVGFGEIHQLSPSGRIFTLILIVLGVGFVAYVIGNVVQFLVEGRIRLILGRHKLDKKIDRLNTSLHRLRIRQDGACVLPIPHPEASRLRGHREKHQSHPGHE